MSCCGTNQVNGPAGAKVEGQAARHGAFKPNVDIYETPDDWVIVADVPGAKKDALDLSFEEGVLNVKAHVEPRQGGGHLLREYAIGDFERSFRVGEGIDSSRISAALDAGVLTVRLPKAESVKPRKIDVRGNAPLN